MNHQISFSGFEPPEFNESVFLDAIFPRLLDAVSAQGGDGSLLLRKATKSINSSGGYTVISFRNFTAFRLKLRKGQHYISIPTVFSDLIPNNFPTKRLKSEAKYIRILVSVDHPIESYEDFLCAIAGETVNRYPKEWDCCSMYMECSDAKTCIHPDKAFALECGYRKILSSGRIFYGQNRNID